MDMNERQARADAYARFYRAQYRSSELDRYGECRVINRHSRATLVTIRVLPDGAVQEWGIISPLPKGRVVGELPRGWN